MINWTRDLLKNRAKDVLRINYWMAFVVAIILAFTTAGSSGSVGSNSNYSFSKNDFNYEETTYEYSDTEFEGIGELYDSIDMPGKNLFVGLAASAIVLLVLFGIALQIFLLNPLAAGCYKFFSSSAEVPHKNIAPVGIAFKQGNYWGIVKGMFLKHLYIFLWLLLFIIPGIIKAYSYRMVPYILTDNPNMDANEAITLSRKMMNGEKWDTFVLDLSFIGWYLLGVLACGIGTLFVAPYHESTNAQLYLVMRDKAIKSNMCTPEMLNLTAN